MVNPFLSPLGGSRSQFNQPQNQYDFSGWGDRLNKIEQGIAGLTDQFKNFQTPGDVAPEYTGNTAPEPLEQTTNATGIESLVAEPTQKTNQPTMAPPTIPTGGQEQQSPFGMGGGSPFGMGGGSPFGGALRQMVPIQPGQEGFNPLTSEQYAGQQDLWKGRQDFSNFANTAYDVLGTTGGRFKPPAFGHAYEDWQDYAAGYGGSDPSQGMENWMQDYNFDLMPERPEWQPGQNMQNIMQEYTNSPDYLAWQQRQGERDPLSQSTMNAMGWGGGTLGPKPINPSVMQGNTYEQYLANVNYQPNQPIGTLPAPSLQGPTQQQIQQGIGALI